jgi:hypothetical protein
MEQEDTFFTLRTAWDALVYDEYEAGSKEEGLAGSVVQAFHSATREPTQLLPLKVGVCLGTARSG